MTDKFINEELIYPSSENPYSRYSIEASYLLWYGVGYLGAHHFYLDRIRWAVLYAALFVTGFLTIPYKIGLVFLAILAVFLIVDFIRLPKIVRHKNSSNKKCQNQKETVATPAEDHSLTPQGAS